MASNIPTRRVTRATRSAIKDNENANARPSRIVTRSKPPSSTSVAAPGASTRSSALSDAAAQNKRKREALGEVTGKAVNNRVKAAADAKGKGKDTTVLKPTKPESATTTARIPLRTVSTRTRSTTAQQTKGKNDILAIDPPSKAIPVVEIPVPSNVSRRATTRTAAVTTTTTMASRRTVHRKAKAAIVEEDFGMEEEPMLKKRRTSSEVGDEAILEDIAEEEVEVIDAENIPPDAVSKSAVEQEQDWDDLDRDDDDDPLMVSEYVTDIFNYLKVVEQATMPNPNYMENQKELAWKMRGILMDWLIQVHSRFKLMPETLFLCVNLIDRFLSARVVSLAKLQLVGVTCMFIAAKVEETIAPSVTNFIYCADSTFAEADILVAERYILKTLDWNLSYPCPLNFLRRISKADEYNVQVRTIGKYLIEVGCLEWRLLATPPSLMAATAMWLARLILDCPDWTPNLRHFSSYPEESLVPTANLILNYILKPIAHESFYKKYASKKFLKASVFVREWALEHWNERTMVSLSKDLPHLKAEACRRAEELAELHAEHRE
ncbi:hypothetical protein EW145_g2355 [Phellinidium pouzarii]|uniref:Uncharacterized protein n=1 Tax=Phellinidium pouzarii TaxID=167371 RepID=A0A4S4LD35_9AGAM|nr:hypothetical protein EW145_g2355 [Phellinidium pouzarii]